MTITEAMEQLLAAYPNDSLNVGLEVWSHLHDSGRQPQTVEWSIWINSHARNYYAPTLEGVVGIALALVQTPRAPLEIVKAAEASVEGL